MLWVCLMFKSKYKNNVDYILAVSGFILGLIIVSLYLLSPTIHLLSIGLSLTLGSALYIAIKKKSNCNIQYQPTIAEKRFLDILFFILFSFSLIIWNNSVDRPFSYFLLLSLCTGVLALSIYVSDTKTDYFIQYCKIILLSFNIKYSIYMFAGFIPGVDPYVHAKMNDLLAMSGNIDVLFGKEMYFPIMHVQTAITQIISNVPIKDASNYAVIIPFIFASTFVYLVTRKLFDEKIGLLSMLLLNISDFHIVWGSSPQTTSYGLILYYLLMYVLFKVFYLRSNSKWISLSIFLTIMLIITHAVSSFIFVVTMFALFLGSFIYNLWYKNDRKVYYSGLFLISVIALLQHWFISMYSKDGKPFFDQIVSSLYEYITGYADFLNRPEATIEIASTLPPFIERFADTMGLSLYLFFAIVGSLMVLSYKYRDQIKFSYILIMIILFGVTFAFPLFGIRNIIPSRWFAFEYFFVSMFAAFAIIHISHVTDRIVLRKVFLVSVFCILAFFMSASTISNLDSPLWLKDSTISTTYTVAEIRGAETLSMYSDNLFSDIRYGTSVIDVYLNMSTTSLGNSQTIFTRENEILLWRNYMLERPIRTFTRVEGYDRRVEKADILGFEVLNELEKENRIYDNSEIIGFYIM
ncbi:MAG: hypothetical protein PWP14_1978 [Methanolobus sp.]|nr:hypothetical protein [Methanolobus sp.]